ncbi:MAG: histidine kinase [Gammaproteobacteria bacterium]|jgi:two-component system sensor histidine kinase PhoQ|nr:ATP-binding protein [Pseudomonas sp.]MDY0413993.1 ATP-binding protein [Pseudomonas sp.]NLO54794.1 histidine kinase [Gammaproteobacteria bacterium]
MPLQNKNKASSLRMRLMFGAAFTVSLFMLALFPALQQVFTSALEQSIEQRLAADASALISAASVSKGQLRMPEKLPDEEFDILPARQLGFIYDNKGSLLWRSRSSKNVNINYQPKYDGTQNHEFLRAQDSEGREFFIYDVEVDLLRGQSAYFSIVTMQPVSDYQAMYGNLRQQLYVWLCFALLLLLGFLWLGLGWGIRSLRSLSAELDDVEMGRRASLSDEHPRELLRLTRSLNRLLESERQQSERYRHSLDDLAHSLKTPLAVLQGVGEVLSTQPSNAEQVRTLQGQVNRMSQQISYQLQRARLRKSGLLRYQVKLKPLLDSLLEALDKVYRDKRVQVTPVFSAELRVPVEQGALLELLGNILENAYRLCINEIRISAQLTANGCELMVEDDGPGVPKHQRERILKRGERLDTQYPGQGIGTAVVKDIIDSYGGQLFVEDSVLGGAQFRIIFPLN